MLYRYCCRLKATSVAIASRLHPVRSRVRGIYSVRNFCLIQIQFDKPLPIVFHHQSWQDVTEHVNNEILAFNLYCKLSFGRLHHRNPQIIELAEVHQAAYFIISISNHFLTASFAILNTSFVISEER